ncbi:hypothetical protein [Dyadobacter sp. NIV53]|uniref:hypothetical protein n=1 Tax=Dyadobacter sp. NIV53 TaxID=2861765 RepID=UPI001C876283|nr:hypothetical protein [Dyadobacter sp. NIV53]
MSVCQQKNQPDPIETVPADSCTSYLNITNGDTITRLDQPSFSLPSGLLPYGSKVHLLADSGSVAGIFEVSIDSGKIWKPAKCIVALNSGEIWGRSRYKNIVSAVTKAVYSIYYKRVIIFGNSITKHAPAPAIGWSGDWGMAASSAEKDYVHIITKELQLLNSGVEIKVVQAIDFEQNFWQYDFAKLQPYADFEPDLIIMRIAENTNQDYINFFEASYGQFLVTLTSKTTPKVICTTSFWKNQQEVSSRIRNVAKSKSYLVADLEPYSNDKSLTAYKSFTDAGVGMHPSDKGMQTIADCISKYF